MILFILSAGERLRHRLRSYFIDKKILFPLSFNACANIMVLDREFLRGGCTCWTQERQVMHMSEYEIVMICIAAIGLLLKMISVLTDRNHKP